MINAIIITRLIQVSKMKHRSFLWLHASDIKIKSKLLITSPIDKATLVEVGFVESVVRASTTFPWFTYATRVCWLSQGLVTFNP